MNQKKKLKQRAREAKQARQAKRVVGGIIIALLLFALLFGIAYVVLQ